MLKTVTSSFTELGLRHEFVEVLAARGIHSPFPVQELTIPDALEGRDVCGKAKTGSGKTLAFGLPVLQRMSRARPKFPTGLVLVPTRELASQVRDELAAPAQAVNRKVLAVYGGAPIEKQIEKLRSGIDLVVATPGRMIDLIERQAISVRDVAHVVVDEADRMADMGFLPQVEWVLRNVRSDRQTLLFSATLDGVVNSLIRRYQHDPVMHEVVEQEFTAKEMTHRFIAVHKMDKVKVAAAIARSTDRTLMFTSTKVMADRLARDLVQIGVKAAAIHGARATGRSRCGKRETPGAGSHRFTMLTILTLLFTTTLPERHLHRAGRTARAGETGLACLFGIGDQATKTNRITEMFSR